MDDPASLVDAVAGSYAVFAVTNCKWRHSSIFPSSLRRKFVENSVRFGERVVFRHLCV